MVAGGLQSLPRIRKSCRSGYSGIGPPASSASTQKAIPAGLCIRVLVVALHGLVISIGLMLVPRLACLVLLSISVSCAPMAGGYFADSQRSAAEVYESVVSRTGRKNVSIVIVPSSEGPVADSVVKGLSGSLGEASLPRSIRRNLEQAHAQNCRAYVGGVSREKVEWALAESLSNGSAGFLTGMVIYTNSEIGPRLKQAASHSGATLEKLEIEMEHNGASS